MNRPNDTPEIIKLEDLEAEYHRLQFLVDTGNERIKKEIVEKSFFGPITPEVPASILQLHPDLTVIYSKN